MKRKRPLVLMLVAVIIAALLTGCGSGKSETKAAEPAIAHQDLADVTGYYRNRLTGEGMRDRLVASWSAVTHLETLIQENVLILTQKNTSVTSGDRYELVKDLYNGEMGIHIEARFYGAYTFDGNSVTLEIPDHYTWIYYRNGRVMNPPSVIYAEVDAEATGNDGCSFYGDYLDYHGYHRVEPMIVTVDPGTGAFVFEIAENDDAAELGVESEDDGFSAGPIFG